MSTNPISSSSVPNVRSSREQELAQKLNERLASRLSSIRERITTPADTNSDPQNGRVLDIRV
jgi:hypothetical protein